MKSSEKYLYFLIIILSVMSITAVKRLENKKFFGGKVVSSYSYKFNNKIQCAIIKGWHKKEKCMCVQIDDDKRMDGSIVFIPMEKEFCDIKEK